MKKPGEKVEDVDDLEAEARRSLKEFFTHKGARTASDIQTARIACSLIASFSREKQAKGAADALNFMIARELASDKTQLEYFLAAAMPQAPIVKALPARKES